VQSPFRLRIDLTHPREYLGRTFFRNTLAGNDLKASGPTGTPLSTTDVAAVQADSDGRSGFRRLFDLKLASGVERELLGARGSGPNSASSRSAVLSTCMRMVSSFRRASIGSTSCSRSATAPKDKCAAHFARRNSSSGAVCVVRSFFNGLKVAWAGRPSQAHSYHRGLRSSRSPKADRKRSGCRLEPLRTAGSTLISE
jgi:hypothetical protein